MSGRGGKVKKLGQNFLVDHSIIEKIVKASGVGAGDNVLEIGPGKGILTSALADSGANVTAVELDGGLYEKLIVDDRFKGRVKFYNANALYYDLEEIEKPFHVVANLPYSVSVPIIKKFIENRSSIVRMTLMTQAEVGRRVTAYACDSNYGTLSLFVSQYCEGERLFTVLPEAFRPRPKVDSAVIQLTPLSKPRVVVDGGDEEKLFKFIKEAFVHRRKTIWNNLKKRWADKESFEIAVGKTGVKSTDRPENLSLENYAVLYRESLTRDIL